MKTKLLLLLFAGAVMFTTSGCDDDDKLAVVDQAFENAFKAKYPNTSARWERDDYPNRLGYYVADFRFEGKYDADAWFDMEANWVMTEIDLGIFNNLPEAVKAGFNRDYPNSRPDDVDRIDRPLVGSIYVIEIDNRDINVFYTEDGTFLYEMNENIEHTPQLPPR